MNGRQTPPALRMRTWLWQGAWLGVILTAVYALLFCLYAIVRVSWNISSVGPIDAGLMATLAANAASILIAALVVTALLALPAAVLGMAAAFVSGWLLKAFKPGKSPWEAALLGAAGPGSIALLLLLALKLATGFAPFKLPLETGLFWLGLPMLASLAAWALAGWKMHRSQ